MGLLDRFLQRQLDNAKQEITKSVSQDVIKHVDKSLTKGYTGDSPWFTGSLTRGTKRYQFTQDVVNGGIQRKKKPGTNVSFETLRAFSINHEVSRACINLRKRQITGMEFSIGTADPDDKGSYDTQITEIKEFFKRLGGRGNGYRTFMNKFVEDLMVLDAVSLEKQRTRGNGLYDLIPIDASTIRLRVDDAGATPEPPEAAFVQVIRGQVTAEFTAEEMIYLMMNPKNDTPYGLAPLESLIVTVSSSLKAGMQNLAWLTDGNIPEGFYTMEQEWQPNQIKEFQEYFDALMSGDETMTGRMKFMPKGNYINPNKRDDMAFQDFNDWLMKITCALFEVEPIEIGFHPKSGLGGAGFAQQQAETGDNKGLLPLALFIEEVFTDIIQNELGYKNLKFDFPTLRQKDERATAEVNEILIRSGQRTIDELRTDDGLEPIGVGKPFVIGQPTFIDEESLNAKADAAEAIQNQLSSTSAPQPSGNDPQAADESTKFAKSVNRDRKDIFTSVIDFRDQQIGELKTFRKFAVNRFKANKPIRPFNSEVLPLEMLESLNIQIGQSDTIQELRECFEEPIKELELLNIDTAVETRREVLAS